MLCVLFIFYSLACLRLAICVDGVIKQNKTAKLLMYLLLFINNG